MRRVAVLLLSLCGAGAFVQAASDTPPAEAARKLRP